MLFFISVFAQGAQFGTLGTGLSKPPHGAKSDRFCKGGVSYTLPVVIRADINWQANQATLDRVARKGEKRKVEVVEGT